MNREKKHLGNLNIGKEIVSLDTDLTFKVIEISYVGTIKIKSLLPDNYIIESGNNKIIIVRMDKKRFLAIEELEELKAQQPTDLFTYKGIAMITKCSVISNSSINNLYINKSELQLWNTLSQYESATSGSGTKQDWAYITTDWENLEFDGNNNKKQYTHRHTAYDKETKKHKTTKEIRKK